MPIADSSTTLESMEKYLSLDAGKRIITFLKQSSYRELALKVYLRATLSDQTTNTETSFTVTFEAQVPVGDFEGL